MDLMVRSRTSVAGSIKTLPPDVVHVPTVTTVMIKMATLPSLPYMDAYPGLPRPIGQ